MEQNCPSHIARKCVCCNGVNICRSPAVLMPFIAERAFGWVSTEITPDWGLRDIKSGQTYSICNTLKCDDCGLIFLDVRFDNSEMAALYFEYRGAEYNRLREKYEPGYTFQNQWRVEKGFSHIPLVESYIAKHVSLPKSVLDWGGDTGINTPFRGSVEEHHVFDISGKSVIAGAKPVEVAEAKRNNYDLIVLMHVLEHVPYPQNSLNEIVSVMKKETVLYIELPCEELVRLNPEPSNSHYRQKRHWHEHINFFTDVSLSCLLKSCGLKEINLSTMKLSSQVTSIKEEYIFSVLCCLDL